MYILDPLCSVLCYFRDFVEVVRVATGDNGLEELSVVPLQHGEVRLKNGRLVHLLCFEGGMVLMHIKSTAQVKRVIYKIKVFERHLFL